MNKVTKKLTNRLVFCDFFLPENLECPESCCQEENNIPEKWSLHCIKWLDDGYSSCHYCCNKHTSTCKREEHRSFLQRNLSTCPKDVKATCNKTLVHPQLEYGSSIWDPPTKSNINKLEAVQYRTARFCHSDYRHTSSVTAMMENLGWEQLQNYRQQTKTIMLYRIVNQLVDIQAASIPIPTGTHTRGHANRFLVSYCRINAYKYQGWSVNTSGNTSGRNSHWYLPVITVLGNTPNFSKNGK